MTHTKRLIRRFAITAAAVVVCFGAAIAAANTVILRRTEGRIWNEAVDAPARQAIVVLGAGVRPDNTPSRSLADRLDAARAAWRAGRAPTILVTGDHGHARLQ